MKSVKLTYTAVQVFYWMACCVTVGFAAVYLQSLGYSNTSLGLILSLGNLLGFAISTAAASLIDRYENINSVKTQYVIILLQGVSIILLILFPVKGILNAAVYTFEIACLTCGMSINTKLCLELQDSGYDASFGVARGCGSLGFTAISFSLGGLVEHYSCGILIPISALFLFIRLLFNYLSGRALKSRVSCSGASEYARSGSGAESGNSDRRTTEPKTELRSETGTVLSVLRDHRHFLFLLIGITLLYIEHEGESSFLINVVRNIGGDTDDMGKLSAFRAFIETPMMFLYHRLRKRFKVSVLMRFAFAAFVLKALAFCSAGSLTAIYLLLLLQPFSFGIMLPALVDYVGLVIPVRDSAKGQALGAGSMTVGSILCSLIAGRLYDILPVRTVLMIFTGVLIVGVIIAWFSIRDDRC